MKEASQYAGISPFKQGGTENLTMGLYLPSSLIPTWNPGSLQEEPCLRYTGFGDTEIEIGSL